MLNKTQVIRSNEMRMPSYHRSETVRRRPRWCLSRCLSTQTSGIEISELYVINADLKVSVTSFNAHVKDYAMQEWKSPIGPTIRTLKESSELSTTMGECNPRMSACKGARDSEGWGPLPGALAVSAAASIDRVSAVMACKSSLSRIPIPFLNPP